MKRFIVFLLLVFCSAAHADTETINWYMGDNVYATTTCESGGDITLPTAPTKYGYTFQGWSGYVPIEYLESTGTQYIDTGVVGDINTEYEITVKTKVVPSAVGTTSYAIFGSRTSATENNIMSTYTVSADNFGIINDFGNYTVTRQIPTISATGILHRYKLTNSKSKRTITDLDTGWTNTVTTTYYGSLTTPTNLYIGYAGSLAGLANVSNLRGNIYSCKIWNNDTLVRDFVPTLDGNGVPCMYDRVEQKYYYNAGTGDFIAGPIIGG